MDFRDYFVGGLVAVMWAAATVYLFKFHSDANFVTWAGICGTMTCVYHWLNIRDSKEKDA